MFQNSATFPLKMAPEIFFNNLSNQTNHMPITNVYKPITIIKEKLTEPMDMLDKTRKYQSFPYRPYKLPLDNNILPV